MATWRRKICVVFVCRLLGWIFFFSYIFFFLAAAAAAAHAEYPRSNITQSLMSKSCSHWCHSLIRQLPPSSCAFITAEECNESILGICRPPRCICSISCHFLHGLKKHKFHSSCFLVQYVSERAAIAPTAWNTSSCACCGHSVAWQSLRCCHRGAFIERIRLRRVDRRPDSAAASCSISNDIFFRLWSLFLRPFTFSLLHFYVFFLRTDV